jgi:hypothetical protein
MYAMTTKRQLWKPVDFPIYDEDVTLYRWRKHPNLYGAMLNIYLAKDGRNDDFNVATVELTAGDLDRLEAMIIDRRLPYTSGFFFGVSGNNQAQRKNDLTFIAAARSAMTDNHRIYFYARW